MPSAKHNSMMDRAMGLISLLLDVTSSLFANRSSSIMVLPLSSVFFTDNARCQFATVHYGFLLAFSGIIAETFLHCYLSVMLFNDWSIVTNEA